MIISLMISVDELSSVAKGRIVPYCSAMVLVMRCHCSKPDKSISETSNIHTPNERVRAW